MTWVHTESSFVMKAIVYMALLIGWNAYPMDDGHLSHNAAVSLPYHPPSAMECASLKNLLTNDSNMKYMNYQ